MASEKIITIKQARSMGLGKHCEDCAAHMAKAAKAKHKRFLLMSTEGASKFHITGTTAQLPVRE